MDWNLFIFVFSSLLIVFQFISLFFKLKQGKNFFYLVSVCSILWGGICYFFYGFPLDEGTVAVKDIPAYERGFQITAGLLITSAFTLLVNFFWKKK